MGLYKKCGRIFQDFEIQRIQELAQKYYSQGRCRISREVCVELNWHSENGKPKEWICREFLIELGKSGLIELPQPSKKSFNRMLKKKTLEQFQEPQIKMNGKLSDYEKPQIKRVCNSSDNDLWDYLVKTYHYLGYTGQVGRFLKYIVTVNNIPVACLGWTGGALHVESRDKHLNWDKQVIGQKLKHIVNNFRFVILPWAGIKYLASHILSRNISIVQKDWKKEYNVEAFVFETFVDQSRFKGTCYKAANWIKVGQTKGFAKTKIGYEKHGIIKDVYLYIPQSGTKRAYDL